MGDFLHACQIPYRLTPNCYTLAIVAHSRRGCEQIQRTTGLWYSAEYSTFSVGDEASNYVLSVGGYSGDAGDAMTAPAQARWVADGEMFSTQDRDNDDWVGISCATADTNGWWYGQCTACSLNHVTGFSIWTTGGPVYDVQASRMMLKLN